MCIKASARSKYTQIHCVVTRGGYCRRIAEGEVIAGSRLAEAVPVEKIDDVTSGRTRRFLSGSSPPDALSLLAFPLSKGGIGDVADKEQLMRKKEEKACERG